MASVPRPGFGQTLRSKSSLCAQDREIEARHFDPRDLVAGGRSTFCIGVGECVAEMVAAWIGMAFE
jgi:hypothetical protein